MPEIVLKKLIDGILFYIKNDYNKFTDKSKTILHKYFDGQVFEKFDYLKEAINLFVNRDDSNQRKLDTRIFFDAERAGIPTIHITLPNEQGGGDGIGVDAGYIDPIHTDDGSSNTYTRRFDAVFDVVVTSDNTFEVLLIYHVLKGMLIATFDTLEILGLQNPKLGGRDLQLKSELVPKNIFFRSVNIKLSYETSVPSIVSVKDIASLAFQETPVAEDTVTGRTTIEND